MKNFKDKALAFLVVFNIGLMCMAFSDDIETFIDNLRNDAPPMRIANSFTYQGRLTTPADEPIESNSYAMEFWFYDDQDPTITEHNALCHWSIGDVVVKHGNFRVVMKDGTGSGDCDFNAIMAENPEVWMELKVKSSTAGSAIETLEPRIFVGAVPRALNAQVAEVAKVAIHGVPVGTMVPFVGATPPAGWIVADGMVIHSSTHPEYLTLINHLRAIPGSDFDNCTSSDTGDICATLPQAQDRFLRGKGPSQGLQIGELQEDAFQGHKHRLRYDDLNVADAGNIDITGAGGDVVLRTGNSSAWLADDFLNDGTNGDPRISDETRPTNVTVLYIIKY